MSVTCDHCGTVSETDHPPLTWSIAMVRGQLKRYCTGCTRLHVRSMEGKLDPEHW